MTVPVLLAPNISNFQTFHSLALFICHLFVDGKFRTAHIVHDQNVFDLRIISEIHLNCFEPIPYVLTDVTRPFVLPWTSIELSDHILQLILFDPDQLPTHSDDDMLIFVFYRLFVLSATDDTIVRDQILKLNTAKITSDSSVLIIHQSVDSNLVCVHAEIGELSDISGNFGSVVPRDVLEQKVQNENLFDSTFGKLEQKRQIVIKHHNMRFEGQSNLESKIPETWNGVPFTINYFQTTLNASYLNLTTQIWGTSELRHQTLIQKSSRSYQELTREYDAIDTEKG